MAVIKPFRAVRYNPQRIDDMHTVVSQPYDRIGPDLQTRYYDLSPYNIVRIIEGRAEPGDDPLNPSGPNVYTSRPRLLRTVAAGGRADARSSPPSTPTSRRSR